MTKKIIATIIKPYVDAIKKNGIPVQDVYLLDQWQKEICMKEAI